MIAKDLINYMIPPLKLTDGPDKASQWMDELRLSELPVTDQGKFLGLFNEENLYDEESDKIEDFHLNAKEAFVSADQHYYEVLKKAYSLGVRLVAVVDENEHFMGVISTEDVIEAFASSSSVNTPGAILVLAMEYRDYSLTEISRIIEMNDAKILSSHMLSDTKEYGKVKLTLKINKEDATHIMSTLEANGFSVIEYFSQQRIEGDTQERYDILMNYLNL